MTGQHARAATTAAQLRKQYREQIKAQADRAEKQKLRNMRSGLSRSNPKTVEDTVRAYAKRLREKWDVD